MNVNELFADLFDEFVHQDWDKENLLIDISHAELKTLFIGTLCLQHRRGELKRLFLPFEKENSQHGMEEKRQATIHRFLEKLEISEKEWDAFRRYWGPKDHMILHHLHTCLVAKQQNKLQLAPWFHGNLTADEQQERLRSDTNGKFLVRISHSSPGNFTVAFRNGKKIMKSNIKNISSPKDRACHFAVGKDTFVSFPHVIKKFKHLLKYPANRPFHENQFLDDVQKYYRTISEFHANDKERSEDRGEDNLEEEEEEEEEEEVDEYMCLPMTPSISKSLSYNSPCKEALTKNKTIPSPRDSISPPPPPSGSIFG